MGESTVVKLKVVCKGGKGNNFKAEDGNWYNISKYIDNADELIAILAKVQNGDTVEITYAKNKTFRNVTDLVVVNGTTPEPEKKQEQVAKTPAKAEKKQEYQKSQVSSDDRTAQIQRGNALNAAAASVAGLHAEDVDTLAQMTLELAERYLAWLRAE